MIKPRFSLIPQYSFRSLTDITPAFFEKLGVSFIMLDIDNTIVTYHGFPPSDAVLQWFEQMKKNGIKPFLVSNSKRKERVESLAKLLGVGFIMKARKPSPNGLHRAIGMSGSAAEQSALVGDQIITDVLAANRAGVASIIVFPIKLTNPVYIVRYLMELPFRWMVKGKHKK